MVAWIYLEHNTNTCTPPAGWTEITACATTVTGTDPDFTVRVYWKRAASESGTYTFTCPSGAYVLGLLAAYSGAVAPGTPIEAANKTSGSGTSNTLPSITTLTADTLLVGQANSWNWSNTWTSTALSERVDWQAMSLYDAAQAAAGASGTKLLTQSASENYIGTIFNIASTAVAPATYQPRYGFVYHGDPGVC